MEYVQEHKLYPNIRVVDSAPETKIKTGGKDAVMFCANSYLGLVKHPKLIEAAIEATKKYGVGANGSRVISGNLDIHREFEKKMAKFMEADDTILFSNGYMANVGVIPALMNPLKVTASSFFERRAVILSDELNHASIIDGIRLSKAKAVVFKHNDTKDLEKKLKKYKGRRKMVVVDGVFSMDGDIAPLPEIVRLCKKYDAISMVDEAHAMGVLGKNGQGTLEYFGLKAMKDVDIVMGTCSKSMSAIGGYVVASQEVIDYLRVASRSYMFSVGITPATAATLVAALEVIQSEPERRVQLRKNIKRLKGGLSKLGFYLYGGEIIDDLSVAPIVPVLIGKDEDAVIFAEKLYDRGFFAPCVRWPAVAKNKARLRLTLMATHTPEQIDGLIKACEEVAKELKMDLVKK
jgi:8-amino-7-oxononanoate synthase